MPYVICRMVLAITPTVEITKAEYDRVVPARAIINELIAVEEKYDAVMENYVELEQAVHDLGIRHLAFQPIHYEEMAAPLNLVSRRVSNLLSSVRLYRDSLPQHAKQLLGARHPAIQPLKDLKHDNPSRPMPYRMMEMIRNYAQHMGPPVADITFDAHKDIDAQKQVTGFSHAIVPLMDTAAILKYREIPDDVRTALAALGTLVNPMPLIRQYIEHIGSIHDQLRITIKELETDSEQFLRDLLARYSEVAKIFPGKLNGVAVGFENADRTISDAQYLVEHRLDYFRYLRVKHLTSANMSRRYVPW